MFERIISSQKIASSTAHSISIVIKTTIDIKKKKSMKAYIMIGPSFGTFSPPMTWTSVKKDQTAHPAKRRITR